MADKLNIKIFNEEELKKQSHSRLRYLAVQYGADPTKPLKQEELVEFILRMQKKTGGTITMSNNVAKPMQKKAAVDPEPEAEEDTPLCKTPNPPPPKTVAKAPAKAAAKTSAKAAAKPDPEPEPEDEEVEEPTAESPNEEDPEDAPVTRTRNSAKKALPAQKPDEQEEASEEEAAAEEPLAEVPQEPNDSLGAAVNAVGGAVDSVLAEVRDMRSELTDLSLSVRKKLFTQSGILRRLLVQSGMGKEDINALLARFDAEWAKAVGG